MPENAVGLVVGVFDLFHVGHLDALRSAAGRCDRLVVGIASDDLTARVTGREPFVPERERREIVAAVRGAAQVVVLEGATLGRDVAAVAPDVIFMAEGDETAGLLVRRLAEVPEAARVELLPRARATASTAVRAALADPSARGSVA
jgi:glycerol-3-phosphate cytidylyltransferase